jgi:Flp pilus assembly secretin CpaC
VAADFNADGHIDLAVVNQGANTVSIFLGNGDGTFGTTTTYATGTLPSGIAEADFNNDGHLDLAISNQTDNTVSILLGNGDGTFGAQATFATDTGPAAILTGDFNGDGIPDLITANQTANDVSVLIGVGNGTFTNVLNAPTGNAPVSLATGDFNGDTLLDLAVADQSGNTVTVLLNSLAAINSLTGSLSSTPYPSADFEDIGLKVKVTPRIHPDNQVTLQLSFDISSLAGTSVNGIPIIGNRQIEQTARLRENETTVLSGIIDREESRAISGFPGLGQVTPLNATSNFTNSSVDTELIIAITPHLLRLPPRNGHSIYAGRGDAPH